MSHSFTFNSKFDSFKESSPATNGTGNSNSSLTHNFENNYSPRSSVVYVPDQEEEDRPRSPFNTSEEPVAEVPEVSEVKDPMEFKNYKGFHNNRRSGPSVPPLSHPIKPNFKKKGSSLLGKLMYSTRKESDPHSNRSSASSGSTQSDQLASLPSFPNNSHTQSSQTQQSHTQPQIIHDEEHVQDDSRNASVSSNRRSVSSSHSSGSNKFKFRLSSLSFDHNNGSKHRGGSTASNGKSRNNSGTSNESTKSNPGTSRHSSHYGVQPLTSVEHPPKKHEPQGQAPSTTQQSNAPELGFSDTELQKDDLSPPIESHRSSSTDFVSEPKKDSNAFDLDIDLTNLEGIVKSSAESGEETNPGFLRSHANSTASISPLRKSQSGVAMSKLDGHSGSYNGTNGTWKAPDSWDVKAFNVTSPKDISETNSDSDTDSLPGTIAQTSSTQSLKPQTAAGRAANEPGTSAKSTWNNSSFSSQVSNKDDVIPQISKSSLPVLYGSKNASHVVSSNDQSMKAKFIIRVFREDSTFGTILNSLETTTAELLINVQKKFFLESTQNYQLSLHIGNYVKILEPYERPMKIQMGLLMLSGYKEQDNLRMIGSEDLSFICKFVVENVYLRNLTHEEETILSKDYVNVDISGLNLKNIPIIFHQHTYEIESLNVADNPAIYIPLDFIQSCNYLSSITFSRNGCSKFPTNFLEAKSLKYLDMEKNFLDELPPKVGHLRELKHLKLNSNQLNSLPKSFSKLINLETLNLSSNYFNSYPDPISDLVNLKDLDLSYNDLSFLPKSISNLTKLGKLNLCTNKLSKTLPEFFKDFVSLKRLDIRYNYITNIDVLGCLPKLEALYASKNYISRFSDKMENFRLLHFDKNPITNLNFSNVLTKLTVLNLSKAKLTIIPPDFFDKIKNIEKLVLDKNHLVNLPENIGVLHKLSYLSLYGNNLQSLPASIGSLQSLQYLDLHSNNLQTIPEDIWYLKSMTALNISSNILSSFPKPPLSLAKRISSSVNLKIEEARNVSKFEEIDEDESKHFDEPPKDTEKPQKTSSLIDSLVTLSLSDNRLTDECFNSISLLTRLKTLNLGYNDIFEIPEGAFQNLTGLTELYISGNELTSLPSEDFHSIKSLRLLFLNNNKLVSLPAELSKLTHLQYLDVGSNQLKYNISNWPYDWSWHWNDKLKYLNFSGNKRFEIKQTHVRNPATGENFDSLLVLKNLKVLGLIDVTLTTTAVPEQNTEMRIRTTASELDNIGYGVSDTMGVREVVSSRDLFIQKFRGNENETLFASFDGKRGTGTQGHKVSSICKNLLAKNFADELNKLKKEETVSDALRRTFLSLNKEINGALATMKAGGTINTQNSELASLDLVDDGNCGSAITVIYIKDKTLYTANVGDIEALLSRKNGEHKLLTFKHDPTTRTEFERIRASGGYVSGDGTLDGDLFISRGAGFFNYLPHLHSGPDITTVELTNADDMIIMATKVFWDYIPYELAVDIIRSDKDDPMLAAQKLRDFAISYGATDKIAVMVISLGDESQTRQKFGANGLYNNLGRENDLILNKKRRDRAQGAGDTALRMLDDEIEPPIGELALVFTDIKNSTLLWDTYPVAMRSAIKIHNGIMRRQLRIVGGYEVKTEGDAFMVSFPSPTSALMWCFNVQQQLLTADWPVEILETDQCFEVTDNSGNIIYRGLSVRMGVHWGSPVCELDVVTRRMDYFGPMVNRASRISAIADGGQICISSDFCDEIKTLFALHEKIKEGKLTIDEAYEGNTTGGQIIEREMNQLDEGGLSYYEIGEKKLKGLEAPEHITLVFPKALDIRFELFQKQTFTLENSNRIFGAIPVESIYGLRTVSLRLEKILLALNGSQFANEFQETSSNQLLDKTSTLFQETELLGLLNHVVIRIENCVYVLTLRQKMSLLKKDIDPLQVNVHTSQIMEELTELIQQVKGLNLPLN